MRTGLITLAVATFLMVGCTSTCLIDSEPQGATIYVDGEKIGETPTSHGFSTSGFVYEYEVKADLAGHQTEIQEVKSHTDAWGNRSWPDRLFFRLARKSQ
jgi:hypothetical protein